MTSPDTVPRCCALDALHDLALGSTAVTDADAEETARGALADAEAKHARGGHDD